ncbi:SIMPL domain-containing protein [Streptomyces sp. NBC_00654]|uniref:SIMPL domain-containing protein n=1 Tax=Streptomyces sp. NBC_00654 TaxID=2975799 RepID=UPI00225BE040|nr:SIMPL domain-containing protein [Streptomyces sp. NBC_00654]MCX4968710.1 SIMPL domain-containing protein [Streptomyces sp. NBC_00654]
MTDHTTPRPYGTPQTPHLTVRGEAHLEADPEIARITITVTARGTDRRTALDDLTRRNTQAIDLIKSYGDAVEKLETGTLSVSPELTRHGRGERIRAYHGHVQLTATLTDFTALGELTARLADHELTRVDGPWWDLRPHSPVHAAARRQAVHEALQRAREYAEALNTRLGALLELTDTDTGPGRRPARAGFAHRAVPFSAAASTEMADAATPIDLEPVRQNIDAQVEASFTLDPPPLH